MRGKASEGREMVDLANWDEVMKHMQQQPMVPQVPEAPLAATAAVNEASEDFEEKEEETSEEAKPVVKPVPVAKPAVVSHKK